VDGLRSARPLAEDKCDERERTIANASAPASHLCRWLRTTRTGGPPTTRAQYACDVAEDPRDIPELDVATMIADMRPPSDDDVPIALDGTRLDTPAKLIAYLREINAGRQAAAQRA
jgi:hypothetical protein